MADICSKFLSQFCIFQCFLMLGMDQFHQFSGDPYRYKKRQNDHQQGNRKNISVYIPDTACFFCHTDNLSIAASITIMEMFAVSQQIAAENYQPLLMYTLVAMVYAVFTTVLSYFQGYLERVVDRQVNANNR